MVVSVGTDVHTTRVVAQGDRAGDVRADEVAGDYSVLSPQPRNVNAVVAVAGNEVSLGNVGHAIGIGTDPVVLRPVFDDDAVSAIGNGACASGIRADEVAGHHVAVGPRPGEKQTTPVPGDNVAFLAIVGAVIVGADDG